MATPGGSAHARGAVAVDGVTLPEHLIHLRHGGRQAQTQGIGVEVDERLVHVEDASFVHLVFDGAKVDAPVIFILILLRVEHARHSFHVFEPVDVLPGLRLRADYEVGQDEVVIEAEFVPVLERCLAVLCHRLVVGVLADALSRGRGGGGARGLGRVRASARRRKREVPTVRDEAVGTLEFPPAGAGEGARGAPAKRRPRWAERFARG
jgi:hypothetical protein